MGYFKEAPDGWTADEGAASDLPVTDTVHTQKSTVGPIQILSDTVSTSDPMPTGHPLGSTVDANGVIHL